MCIICVEIQNGRLRGPEASRNFSEMKRSGAIDEDHLEEVADIIMAKLLEEDLEEQVSDE